MTDDNQNKSALEVHPGPKDEPFQSWTRLYALTEHWQSDVKFFHDELRFLHTLIDKYLLKLIEEDNVSKIAPLTLALTKLEARNGMLQQKLVKHLEHLQALTKNPVANDSRLTNDEHVTLEHELVDFVKDFRFTKGEIFRSTEHVLKSEKAKHLLAH